MARRRHYTGQTLTITDLITPGDHRIRRVTAEGCDIHGPATLIDVDGLLPGNIFVGDPWDVLTEDPANAILILESDITRCTFHNVRVLVDDKLDAVGRILTRPTAPNQAT